MTDKADKPRKTLSLKPSTGSSSPTKPGVRKRAGKRLIRVERPARKSPKKTVTAANKRKVRQPSGVPSPSSKRADVLDQQLMAAFEVWRTHQPLALGIEKSVFRFIAEHHISASKRVVQILLHRHTTHSQYLANIIEQSVRYHLDGSSAEVISHAEKVHAQQRQDGHSAASD